MMKTPRLYFVLILICAIGQDVSADSTTVRKKTPHFLAFGMGTMIGCTSCQSTGKIASFSSSATYGRYLSSRWSWGVGLGFDRYEHWQILPLFGVMSFDLLDIRTSKIFAQINYGYSIARIDQSEKTYGYKGSRGGEVLNPSLGYKIDYGPIWLSFSLGYKFQRVYTSYDYYFQPLRNYIPVYPANSPNSKETRIDMTRFILEMRIGWK